MPSLLVVDDAPPIHDLFAEFFPARTYSVTCATNAREAREAFTTQRPDVVVLDVRLPDVCGLDLFGELRAGDASLPVIFITSLGSSGTAIEATKRGAFDYLVKPLHVGRLREAVDRALEMRRLGARPATPAVPDEDEDALTGRCPAMQEVYKAIGRVAPSDVTVLIRGETGTGKELVARVIYQHSRRAGRPFLAINCAAIPEALLESELFGHEKGAFTGADRQRIGKFEQCAGGTLFLDEIGDMPLPLQAKMLRVLQEQQVQRIGGNQTVHVDVRVVAATNRDLEAAVAAGQFRADLYYRLNVFSVHLPPLRERSEDLPALTEYLLRRLATELDHPVCQIAPDALAALARYPWPGNIRELQSVLKQAILGATGPVLMLDCLPRAVRGSSPSTRRTPEGIDLGNFVTDRLTRPRPDLHAQTLEVVERTLIARLLQHTLGNQTATADLLGITRGSLRFKIRALGIDVDHAARTGEPRLEY